jgi:hypothetical protein
MLNLFAAVSLLHRDGGLAIGRTVVLVHCIVLAMCCCSTEGQCTLARLGIHMWCLLVLLLPLDVRLARTFHSVKIFSWCGRVE